MNKKPTECNKTYYHTENEVKRVILLQRRKYPETKLYYYFCEECNGYHISERLDNE